MRLPRVRLTVGRLMGLIALGGVGLGAYATWVQPPRDNARCQTNLRTIGLALDAYQSHYGCLPPAQTTDASGRPIHSWRALLLPYLDEPELARAYRLDEPWDGPSNRRLALDVPGVYQCPRHSLAGCSSYVVVTGSETAWPGRSTYSITNDSGPDTLLAVELTGGVPWLEPRDLTLKPMAAIAPRNMGDGTGVRHWSGEEDANDQLRDLYRQGMARPGSNHRGVNLLMPHLRVVAWRRPDGYGTGMIFRYFLTTDHDWDQHGEY